MRQKANLQILRAIKGKRQRLQQELDALNKDDTNYKEKAAAKKKEIENQKDADVNSKSYNFKEVTKYWLNQEEENDFYKDYEEDKLRKMPVNLQGTMLISGLHYEFFRIKTKSNDLSL